MAVKKESSQSTEEATQNPVLSRLPGLLNRAIRNPKMDTVHKLRTTIRRIETALKLATSTVSKKLLKQLKETRKRAGRVRNLDVQLEILKSIAGRNHADATTVRRVLLKKREKQERKLSKSIRADLHKNVEAVRLLTTAGNGRRCTPLKVDLQELAASFLSQHRSQPLTPHNLHAFRVACKHLRYKAEVAPPSEARDEFITELRRVQDAIGLWHDYVTLIASAEKVLGSDQTASLQRHLHVQAHAKYLDALRTIKEVERKLEDRLQTPSRKPSQSEPADVTRSAVAS